ncbi:hypothetical protein N665_5295s0002 [Sinapis alba]|nr:hypothetical protein N665_5295s0002 [Sinapis alba]
MKMKKPSSRSQRVSRVTYSLYKKKELYETDGKKLLEREDGLVKLGRKDLLPGYHKNEKHVEEDEDEINHEEEEKESKSKVENGTHEEDEEKEEDEEDKSKLGEEVVVEEDEEENKHEEYEIDEQDQSKTDEDTDKDDELLEEEKEKETNHADETDMTVDEAREEHYKADDASSAVSHESRILNTEKLSENSTGTAQENNSNATLSEVEVQKEPVLEKTTTEVKDGDSESSTSEAKSVVNESRGETTVNGNSTEGVLEASGFLQNETKIMQERSQEDGAPPSGSSDEQTVVKLEQTRNESAPNITISANVTSMDSIQDESRNSTSESSVTENISGSNRTEVKENTRSEGDVETGEKESSNYFPTEQTEEADDTPESTMLQEEREALTDPQTLPDIRIEGNEDDEEEAISAE